MFFCLLCHGLTHPKQDLCHSCRHDLPWNQHHCERCGEPWPTPFQGLCQPCVSEEPYFDQCFAPFRYGFPIDQLILQGKGGKRAELLFTLGRLLAEALVQHRIPLPDAIIPVPLHPHKQQKRGYNQAGVLAQVVGRTLAVPVRHDLLLKIREPGDQKSLSRSGRQHNIQRAFRVQRSQLKICTPPLRHIVLLDDVITTGSTINQLAKQLRSSGVERVDGWALARAAKQIYNQPSSPL
ncbi:MAG: ComF family protein [Pseudomonadota bacterium]|nr:ComF family protein [Pseudomonadota bacterium]